MVQSDTQEGVITDSQKQKESVGLSSLLAASQKFGPNENGDFWMEGAMRAKIHYPPKVL